MKRTDSKLLAGLILFVAGAAVFAYGLIGYNAAKASVTGALQRLFNGSSPAENQAVIEMIAGGAVALIGLVLVIFRRGRSRR
jgi:hypothetical protein